MDAQPTPRLGSLDARTSLSGASLPGGTLDLPMVGPSRRHMAVGGSVIGILGVVAGAVVAVKTVRVPEFTPVTSVGLVGEPSAVTHAESAPPEPESAVVPQRLPQRPPQRLPQRISGRAPGEPRGPAGRDSAESPGSIAPSPRAEPRGSPREPGGEPSQPAGDAGSQPENPALAAVSESAGADAGLSPSGPLAGDGTLIEGPPRDTRRGYRMGDSTDATGTMDPGVFSFVYRRYAPQIATCYSNATRVRGVSGVIVVRVRIGADGHVVRTRVISDTAHAPGLSECVQTSMRAWQYPQPEGGEVEVDYPLRFGGAH